MTNSKIVLTLALFLVMLTASFASASLLVDNVNQEDLYPGQEAGLSVRILNDFNYDVEDVKMTLVFNSFTATGQIDFSKPTSFSSVGSSSDEQDSIDKDDSEVFSFNIKASNSIEPGNYNIPYQISYTGLNNSAVTETGSIGITVNSKTSLDFSINQETKVIGMQDKVTFKIINKGFGEVKFLTVQANEGTGYTLLSEKKIYIGSIASDDSDSASFDVLLNKANPSFSVLITYKDFENNDKSQTLSFDLTAYTREKAIELGLIKKSNAPFIVGVIILIVIVWFVVRLVRRARKRKANSLKNSGGN